MDGIFTDRITDVPKSFIREILKVALNTEVISFAGGLSNRELFSVKGITKATNDVFDLYCNYIFQYIDSEGDLQLREYPWAKCIETR